MTSSLTTALEELRRENDVLKTEVTQLRTDNATMKDEIGQLKTENVQLKARHVDTSRSLHPLPVPPKEIKHKLKVSQWSGIT